jgi:hypothetical protein
MNVFLVETPHQLLNAMEAKSYFSLVDNNLIIIIKEEYSKDSYARLVAPNEWKSVFYVPARGDPESGLLRKLRDHCIARIRGYYSTYELYLLRKALDRLSEAMGKVERIFLGNYWMEYMRHFANVTPHKELCLLDDGTGTLLINKMRRERWFQRNDKSRVAIVQGIINSMIGMKDRHIENVTFFTIYDLEVRDGDRLVKHDYVYLKEKASERPIEDVVYFLGMTLIDEGLSQEAYINYLRRVKTYFSNENLVYVQHRGEPAEKLEIIKKQLKLEMRKFDVPIEYQISVLGNRPKTLASFCSSALENCRIIFGELLDIKAFYLDPADCPMRPDFIRDIYSYYESRESAHFQMIKLQQNVLE